MNILFYGGHKWESGPWFRKQQFASRLTGRGHNVFYIESTVSIVRKSKFKEIFYFKTSFKKINEKLYIITPSALFPFPNNYYSRKLYNLKLLYDIKRFFKKNEINDFILWFNQVEFASILKNFSELKIFDLADDRPYYSKLAEDEKGYKTMLRYVKEAFSKSDVSIVSAYKIKEKYQKYSKSEPIVIPNGHNIDLKKENDFERPSELKNIKGPIVGFIGTLFWFLDEDLIEYIISKRPQYSFVFVGPSQNNFNVSRIRKYKNCYLLGEKKKTDIPKYINSFDVCINPFKVHEVNDSVSPVKVFEYLALRKSVVSTRMYSLEKEKISQTITFANTYDDFLDKLDEILISKSEKVMDKKLLSEYSWDSLFEKLLSDLGNKYEIKL